ncbi:MAG: transglutaminase-like domain-containing protein, partial [Verrucomicrobiota bacterium]
LDLKDRALELQREYRQDDFYDRWKDWLSSADLDKDLEGGLILLSEYLEPSKESTELEAQLDRLAEEFHEESLFPEFRNLANFLFSIAMFSGDTERYYHPDNSNLRRVLERKKGNPISLACIFILVGQRLDLEVGGCNYPAHFLARAICQRSGELFLIDCFNDGRVISATDLVLHHPLAGKEVREVVSQEATAGAIFSRILRNLENSFGQNNLMVEERFIAKLQSAMQSRIME